MNKHVILIVVETDGTPEAALAYTRALATEIAPAIRQAVTTKPTPATVTTSVPAAEAQSALDAYRSALLSNLPPVDINPS